MRNSAQNSEHVDANAGLRDPECSAAQVRLRLHLRLYLRLGVVVGMDVEAVLADLGKGSVLD